MSREKPYLFVDGRGRYNVRVPSAQTGTSGVSWADGITAGRTIPLRDFFVVKPWHSARDIDKALARRMHLLFTPGVYDIARSIAVKRTGTVVLGMGHATLTAVRGAVPITVADVPGVVVAGMTIDAGTRKSPLLLQVGKRKGHNHRSSSKRHRFDPTTLSDVYFRVGGPHIGKVDVALEVNSDDVLIDHTWVWRADHGVEGFSGDTERWNTNIGRLGVVVNGDDVTATGLFVEHFQQYNTVWNGERGETILYQNELPYDPPSQADWMHDGVEGWAGYKVWKPGAEAQPLRRRRLRLQPQRSVDPHRERLRGPADARRAAPPRDDGQPRRRHHRPRGQRRRWAGGRDQNRPAGLRRRLSVTPGDEFRPSRRS